MITSHRRVSSKQRVYVCVCAVERLETYLGERLESIQQMDLEDVDEIDSRCLVGRDGRRQAEH